MGSERFRQVTEIFGADLRSLATFRIVLAIVVLVDLAARATDFYAHYTDEGVLPLWLLRAEQQALGSSLLSLNLLNGEPLFQALVFGVAALAALALLVGYRTRLATVVLWVMVLSIQWRSPLVISGADVLLRLLLFWGMFLPLGAYWSTARARPRPLCCRRASFRWPRSACSCRSPSRTGLPRSKSRTRSGAWTAPPSIMP